MKPKALMSNIIGQFIEGSDVGKDCVIVTKEKIEIEANRIILLQSPFMEQIFQSRKCGCDNPEKLYLVFPDISYRHMDIVLDYFYTGTIRFNQADKGTIRDILFNIFQISGTRLTDINNDEVFYLPQDNQNSIDSNNTDSFSAERQLAPSPSPEAEAAPPPSPTPSSSSSFSGGISSPEEDVEEEDESTIDSQEGFDENMENPTKDDTEAETDDGVNENNAVNEIIRSDSEETIPINEEESRSRVFDFEDD